MIFLSVLLLGKKAGHSGRSRLGSCRPSRRIRRLRSMDVSDKGTHGVHNGSFHRGGHKEEKTSCQDRIGSGCGDRGNGTAGIEMVIGYAAVDGVLAGNLWSGILGALSTSDSLP